MRKRCKTCIFWEAAPKAEWGECVLARTDNAQAKYPDSLAQANDFEGYMASLSTRVDFGCVQWEKREG